MMLSRIESRSDPGDVEPVEMSALVKSAVDEVRFLVEKNGLEVSEKLEQVELIGNRKNLYQLVSNLIVNAVKYNRPGGGVDITLSEDGEQMLFRVRNDGESIPLDQQRRVFERFYRVDKGRSRAVGGTGLGLSIVRHVVDSMNGTVTLTSDPVRGTIVTVALPMVEG